MGKDKFVYLKIYLGDLEIIEKTIPPETAAKVLFAAGNYMKDGTIRDIPAEGAFAFAMLQQQIDRAKEAYQELSEARAAAGAKGGKAKAANAKAKAEIPAAANADGRKFTRPTKKQFKQIVSGLVENGELDEVEEYDVSQFYDELKASNWKLAGASFLSREDVEEAIRAKFDSCGEGFASQIFYSAFAYCFGKCPRDENGDTTAYYAAADFIATYGKKSHTWRVGELVKTNEGAVGAFKREEWQAALDAFLTTWAYEE